MHFEKDFTSTFIKSLAIQEFQKENWDAVKIKMTDEQYLEETLFVLHDAKPTRLNPEFSNDSCNSVHIHPD